MKSHDWVQSSRFDPASMLMRFMVRCYGCRSYTFASLSFKEIRREKSSADGIFSELLDLATKTWPEDCEESRKLNLIRCIMDS